MSGWFPIVENQTSSLENIGYKPHLSQSNFDEVFMTDLIALTNPENLQQMANAITSVTQAVSGLRDAVYETISLVWTDPVKRRRRAKNLEAELRMAEEMIKGQKRLDDISATLAKEVLEPAMEEDREELQKIWAALIARILVGKDKIIGRKIIDIIKECDSHTAIFVSALPTILEDSGQNMIIGEMSEIIINQHQEIVDIDDVYIALNWLIDKGCLAKIVGNKNAYETTPLGRKLIQAVTFPEDKKEEE